MSDAHVEVAGVDVELGGTPILDDVDLSAAAGTFVGLIGPNGAGKTTLLRTVNGALTPDSGSVTVAGEDVHALSSKAASRLVATVPQETNLSFEFDVREVIEMGRTPHLSRFGGWSARDAAATDRAVARACVDHLQDRDVSAVSGGERQRVLLARALAQETPVLLLDEPTASLDVNHQVQTLSLVGDLVDEGRTAVAAIHDLDLAARFCDELLLLSDGAVAAAGDPEAVLEADRLDDAFDARTVVATDPVTGTPAVTATADAPTALDAHVHLVAAGAAGAALVHRLARLGFEVSVGPVTAGSAPVDATGDIGAAAVTTPPFEALSTETLRATERHVRAADAVLVYGFAPRDLPSALWRRLREGTVVVAGDDAASDAPARPRDAVAELRARLDDAADPHFVVDGHAD